MGWDGVYDSLNIKYIYNNLCVEVIRLMILFVFKYVRDIIININMFLYLSIWYYFYIL